MESFTFHVNTLIILQLCDLVESSINVVQCKQIKVWHIPVRLVQVIHEHLPHLVDGQGGVDGAVEAQLTHCVRQGSEVKRVWVRQQYCIYVVYVSETINNHTNIIKPKVCVYVWYSFTSQLLNRIGWNWERR